MSWQIRVFKFLQGQICSKVLTRVVLILIVYLGINKSVPSYHKRALAIFTLLIIDYIIILLNGKITSLKYLCSYVK